MKSIFSILYRVARFLFICVALVGAAIAFAYVTVPWHHAEASPLAKESREEGEQLRRSGSEGLEVPADVARKMGLRTAQAVTPSLPIALPAFQGCLALDSNSLARVRSRFAGEVVSVGTTTGGNGQSYVPGGPRLLRVGDRVEKGTLLAVVWSKDLGEKKSELVDATSKLRSDKIVLTRARDLFQSGSGTERGVRDALRAVESDQVAVERAERTLRAWGLSVAEVAEIRAEAEQLARPDSKRNDPATWARVEVRSPRQGVILEKNLAAGDIVDTSTDLFKVGDLSHLTVWAHVYEEDLPLLQALPKPVNWTVTLPSRPGTTFSGTLDQVGEMIDPNQHTALISGKVENPDGLLKVGQFVTVSVSLPPPQGEVKLPVDAVVEDGRESVVFVQEDLQGGSYTRHPVRVVRRLRDAIYIRADPEGVLPGKQVVTNGSLLLREAMASLPRPEGKAIAVRHYDPDRAAPAAP